MSLNPFFASSFAVLYNAFISELLSIRASTTYLLLLWLCISSPGGYLLAFLCL
ncbi:hypothetical protein ACJIZ3_007098 [Penstemon smallii]|uniref:Uncharacterized protein n=1 Tax=Penstemon smallii TaxID=265156 RepID=A0ABD3S9U6_9LAMI